MRLRKDSDDSPWGNADHRPVATNSAPASFISGREFIDDCYTDKISLERVAKVCGVHRVTLGNFLGRHHGKIVEMSDTYVAVIEIVSDGTEDGWVERPRTIKLTGM